MTTCTPADAPCYEVHEQPPSGFDDHELDWTAWLADVADTIAMSTWSSIRWDGGDPAETPLLVLSASTHDTTKAKIWASGGVPGGLYLVTCSILTATGSRSDTGSFLLRIRRR